MSKPKIRATILDIPGKERYEIIKATIDRFNTAIEHNFYFEATALIESLICDRLESRLGELSKSPVEFDTIGNLLKDLRKIEKDVVLLEIMNKQLNKWCGERNHTIHEIAKIQLGKKKDWNEFLNMAKTTAKDGRIIFNLYNKQLQKLRRTAKIKS
jgi:hypothetical protein